MYGVPQDLDLRAFHGARLNQLCLGSFDMQFHFSTGHVISVEGSWQLADATGVIVDESIGRVGEAPGNQSRGGWLVRNLLSATVIASQVDAPRSFRLIFATGHQLIIFDDSESYESFSIQPGDVFV